MMSSGPTATAAAAATATATATDGSAVNMNE